MYIRNVEDYMYFLYYHRYMTKEIMKSFLTTKENECHYVIMMLEGAIRTGDMELTRILLEDDRVTELNLRRMPYPFHNERYMKFILGDRRMIQFEEYDVMYNLSREYRDNMEKWMFRCVKRRRDGSEEQKRHWYKIYDEMLVQPYRIIMNEICRGNTDIFRAFCSNVLDEIARYSMARVDYSTTEEEQRRQEVEWLIHDIISIDIF